MTDSELEKRLSEAKSLLNQYKSEWNTNADFSVNQVNTFLRDILSWFGLGGVYQNIVEKASSNNKYTPEKMIKFEFDALSEILNELSREAAKIEADFSSEKEKISDNISNLVSDIASLNFGSNVSSVDRYKKQLTLKKQLNDEKRNLAQKTYNYYQQSSNLDQQTRKVQRQMDDVSNLKVDPYFEQITKITKGDS